MYLSHQCSSPPRPPPSTPNGRESNGKGDVAHVKEMAGERIQREVPKNAPQGKRVSIKPMPGPQSIKPA